jgi:hypothetical protein
VLESSGEKGKGSMPFRSVVIFFLCGGILIAARAAGADSSNAPTPEQLVQASRRTVAHLQTTAAAWDCIITGGTGTKITVAEVFAPGGRWKRVFTVNANGQRLEIARIIEVNGLWYVREMGHAGKYRPREAPFRFASLPIFDCFAQLHPSTAEEFTNAKAVSAPSNGAVDYQVPLPESVRDQTQKYVDQLESLAKSSPELLQKPENREQLDKLKELIERGSTRRYDVENGIVLEGGIPGKLAFEVHGFHWLDSVPPEEFRVDDIEWEDNTAPLGTTDPADLVMMAHNGMWKPGMPAGDPDARLVELSTGRFRRIPFEGAESMPACFLPDRRHVIVTGVDLEGGGMAPFEIDLVTGANRRLGGATLAHGATLVGSASPDGKLLTASRMGVGSNILQFQLYLIDITTGEAATLGPLMDAAFFTWTRDSKALIFERRVYRDPNNLKEEPTHMICRLDLTGHITDLREGGSPQAWPDGKFILYEDRNENRWYTCDMDGKNPKLFGNGLSKHAFPAPSPDGRRLLMLKQSAEGVPAMVIVNVESAQETPAITQPGLWTYPQW